MCFFTIKAEYSFIGRRNRVQVRWRSRQSTVCPIGTPRLSPPLVRVTSLFVIVQHGGDDLARLPFAEFPCSRNASRRSSTLSIIM